MVMSNSKENVGRFVRQGDWIRAAHVIRMHFHACLEYTIARWVNGDNPSDIILSSLDIYNCVLKGSLKLASPNAFHDIAGTEVVGTLAFLVGESWSCPDTLSLNDGRQLDLELSRALHGFGNAESWQNSMRLLAGNISELAYNTYSCYARLLRGIDVKNTISLLVKYFLERDGDEFFDQIDTVDESGQLLRVDHRLGAILKFVKLKSATLHDWSW
jgi:hypothetical protein